MTGVLVRKLLTDLRVWLGSVCLLLFLFQMLWAHVSRRISGEILTKFESLGISVQMIRDNIFAGPGQIIQTIMGGEDIKIEEAGNLMTVAYVHPFLLTVLCIWAVGRASSAIAGEIDRGTMELLLAQPIRRSQIILAHLCTDAVTIAFLCVALWTGTWFGTWLVGLQQDPNPNLHVEPLRFLPALLSVAGLLFSVSGYTLWLSAAGRFRNRVLGLAVLVTLLQFLLNIVGQLWQPLAWMRPYTVFYHYQPQSLILQSDWTAHPANWHHLAALLGTGTLGYLLAWWTFCKRDLPAPL